MLQLTRSASGMIYTQEATLPQQQVLMIRVTQYQGQSTEFVFDEAPRTAY